ncbi:putative acid phosphatase [Trypanosoma conorhini]|uniref:Putative acid phosphatase n=1 Tax=Trypanosoma conorhini TaxID=83891 RepID=A0A422Q9E0_9TRYP|nr:putative acid phosphatase [Trypanosoma conorhini]RNF26576.1 putative acid phosphatase [Trypanosoma conorhini]
MALISGRLLVSITLLLILTNVKGFPQHFAAVAAAASERGPRHHYHAKAAPISDPEETPELRKGLEEADENELVLTKLFAINRHGHRAPNAPYWDFCPKDLKNRRKYDVQSEDLTGLGMKEEYELGQYIRRKYASFIGNRFNRTLHFFRAVGEPRILQSSVAVAQGIFPDGFGPGAFLPNRPQFVPVFSDMDTHEYLLDDVPCFRRAERDVEQWVNKSLAQFVADENVANVLSYIKHVCGKPTKEPPSLYAYIKTVADGMIFNADYGMKVCGGRVAPDMLFRIRNVSMQLLLARLYNTDEQQTYTAVDLPHRLIRMLEEIHLPSEKQMNDFVHTRQESIFYFLHREGLYAFAEFFGFTYNVPHLPRSELPVASTLIIEKLQPKKLLRLGKKGPVYVKIILKTPYDGTSTVEVPQCKVPQLCQVHELRRIYDQRVARTGSWEKLCNYTYSEIDHNTDIR